MSRTYRNKGYYWWNDPLVDNYVSSDEIIWEDVDSIRRHYEYCWSSREYFTVKYGANTKTGRKSLARNRRDKVSQCKEPGPSWFRNLYTERPLRRETKRELQKFMQDTEYEPMIDEKGKLEYWT